MKTLFLNIKKKWYDMILSGEKKEEYRDITPYYVSKLFNWRQWPNLTGLSNKEVIQYFADAFLANPDTSLIRYIKDFDSDTFRNGYSKNDPQFKIEFLGLEIREGKQEWGAKDGVKYFVLNLGKIIEP